MPISEYRPIDVHDMPADILEGCMYVNRRQGHITLHCPCGCGEIIHIPFRLEDEHRENIPWTMEEHDGRCTLRPSVQMKDGCKSHYHITDNRVVWA